MSWNRRQLLKNGGNSHRSLDNDNRHSNLVPTGEKDPGPQFLKAEAEASPPRALPATCRRLTPCSLLLPVSRSPVLVVMIFLEGFRIKIDFAYQPVEVLPLEAGLAGGLGNIAVVAV